MVLHFSSAKLCSSFIRKRQEHTTYVLVCFCLKPALKSIITRFYRSTLAFKSPWKFRVVLQHWTRQVNTNTGNCPTRWNTKQSIYYLLFSLQRGQASLAKLEGGSCTKNMTSTGSCSYSFVYSSWPRWREVAAQKIWPVPEAVVTVLCTPLGHVGGR